MEAQHRVILFHEHTAVRRKEAIEDSCQEFFFHAHESSRNGFVRRLDVGCHTNAHQQGGQFIAFEPHGCMLDGHAPFTDKHFFNERAMRVDVHIRHQVCERIIPAIFMSAKGYLALIRVAVPRLDYTQHAVA